VFSFRKEKFTQQKHHSKFFDKKQQKTTVLWEISSKKGVPKHSF